MHIETNKKKILATVWWTFAWRMALVSTVVAFGLGILLWVITALLNTPELIDATANILMPFSLIISSWMTLRWTLRQRFRGMRLILADIDSPQ